MDESVISGANLFFPDDFGIPQTGPNASNNQWLLGLVNGALYVRTIAILGPPRAHRHVDSSTAVLSAAGFLRL